MIDDVVTKVLALFDDEDIPFIKARKYLEYEEKKKAKSYGNVKKIGGFNGNRKTKMGRLFLSRD